MRKGYKSSNLDIHAVVEAKKRVQDLIEEGTENCRTLEDSERQLVHTLEVASTAKAVAFGLAMIQQRQLKRYEEVIKEKYMFLFRDPVARRVELLREREKLERVNEVVKKVGQSGSPQVFKLCNALKLQ